MRAATRASLIFLEAVDLALLAVPDAALEEQVRAAAVTGARSAVIFGSAVDPDARAATGPGLRERVAAIARDAGMAVCGAGCMGFVNVARGLRAIGYTEADPLPAGPVALVTHSGSVFSALLRTRRAFGFTLAVSSGQELVTPAAAYARYALTLPETKILALVLETIRDAAALRSVLADAAARDIPVFLLAAGHVGGEPLAGRRALRRPGGGRRRLAGAGRGLRRAPRRRPGGTGGHPGTVQPRPAPRPSAGGTRHADDPDRRRDRARGQGLATVHDSGFERAHVADLAAAVGVPFAPLTAETRRRLAAVLDPGLEPGNPLDVWGTGRDAEALFTEALLALADDPGIGAVALAVDLVPEYDGDDSYRAALLAAAAKTAKPVAVLASIPAAIDAGGRGPAARLRRPRPRVDPHRPARPAPPARPRRAAAAPELRRRRSPGRPRQPPQLADAGAARRAAGPPPSPRARCRPPTCSTCCATTASPPWRPVSAATVDEALAAAAEIGYPVALKTDAPDIAHKSDVGGVRLGIAGPGRARRRLRRTSSARLGPGVTVTEMAGPGPELILGMARDPALGPLIVVGAGGVLAEYLAERSVALPPLTGRPRPPLIARLALRRTCWPACAASRRATSTRWSPPSSAFSALVTDLGEHLAALRHQPADLLAGRPGRGRRARRPLIVG